MNSQSIAIVEDEFVIRENYADALRRQGYKVGAYGGRLEALRAFRQRLPDLVIVDIGLGDEIEGGFQLCRDLRSQSKTLPIIFLTARDSDLDTVSGLRLEADDYLTKSISLPHLTARIAALFRRVRTLREVDSDATLISIGSLTMDVERMSIRWNETPVILTVTEFWIVHALAKRPGHVKSREQLMQAANVVVDDSTITSHVKRIRRKFEALSDSFQCIDTIYGMGYRWVGDNRAST